MSGVFDPAVFDPAAFDTGAAITDAEGSEVVDASIEYVVRLPLSVLVSVPVSYRLPLALSVADARVFHSSIGDVAWSARVMIGDVDYSDLIDGVATIRAAADAARLLEISVTPPTAAAIDALESAQVTVDITISGGGFSATDRRFTGVVQTVDIDWAARHAVLTCRDKYQERINAQKDSESSLALLGGMAFVSPLLLEWNSAEPNPAAYFAQAKATAMVTTFLSGSGVWRAVPWDLSAPTREYGVTDVFDPGIRYRPASRADTPKSVTASLVHRFHRLHNAEVRLRWSEPLISDYVNRGIPPPPKSMVAQAIDGLGEWVVRGEAILKSPIPGVYTGPGHAPLDISYSAAAVWISSLDATVYRRWYQEVERTYSLSVDMGGSADVDASISREIRSDFDASTWESGRRSAPALGIYTKNAPPGSVDAPVLSGYESLTPPWPPANRAIDWFDGLSANDLKTAATQVVAEAVCKAASGRRSRKMSFSRPVDLRLDIGSVIGVNSNGLSAVGQAIAWTEDYNFDTGECVGEYEFAVPKGSPGSLKNSYQVVFNMPEPKIIHGLLPPTLSNFIGGDADTINAWVPPDSISGYLCNTLPTSDHADPNAPMYEQQFRIVMPEIPASMRDPLREAVDLSVSVDLADADLSILF